MQLGSHGVGNAGPTGGGTVLTGGGPTFRFFLVEGDSDYVCILIRVLIIYAVTVREKSSSTFYEAVYRT